MLARILQLHIVNLIQLFIFNVLNVLKTLFTYMHEKYNTIVLFAISKETGKKHILALSLPYLTIPSRSLKNRDLHMK